MGHTRYERSAAEFDMPYEKNEIGVKGILWFLFGLLLLIIITFGLMYLFMNVLETDAVEKKSSANPMLLTEKERLPPEPRLQSAPGFGVDGPNGRVVLELTAPQAEYWELQKEWDELREKGAKDPDTGTIIALPIADAKKALLEQHLKARSGEDADKTANESRTYISDAGSGRVASAIRR